MTKQTVCNMNLIIKEMVKQTIGMYDYKSLKALSHSYETLLEQLDINSDEFKDHKLTNEIESQLVAIQNLKEEMDSKSIPKLLNRGDYISVNHLTTTTTRLYSINNTINRFLISLYKKYNSDVLIIFNQSGKGESKLKKLIDYNNEQVVEMLPSYIPHSQNAITNKYTYKVMKFNSNLEGRRFDFAYIDENLTNEEKNMVIDTLRNKNNYQTF